MSRFSPADLARKHTLAQDSAALAPVDFSEAICILDTGVGLAFSGVNRLDLLTDYYGQRLHYVQAVFSEWDLQAGLTVGGPMATRQEFQVHHAAKRLVSEAPRLWGDPVDFAPSPEALARMKAAIVAGKSTASSSAPLEHGGEAESILYAEYLRDQKIHSLFLGTNDGPAIRVAESRRVHAQHQQQILLDMCRADLITSATAQQLFGQMNAISTVSGNRLVPWS